MGREIAADTSFLIDFQREREGKPGRVAAFLASHAEDRFTLPLTALGEFAAGFADLGHPAFLSIRSVFGLLPQDEIVAMHYREIFRILKTEGRLIGQNDLWIAAACLRHHLPLVTRNVEEFGRVPQLEVLGY